jgi:mannose-6-phosphate isomerase class I
MSTFRNTTQDLAPVERVETPAGRYNVYPSFSLGVNKLEAGYTALAERIHGQRCVVLDGYGGVLWENFRLNLDAALSRLGVQAAWIDARDALLPEAEIDAMIAPFLGGDDPIFGTRYTGNLRDFFDGEWLAALRPDPDADLSILYGCGAALAGWDGPLVYVDVPKNEIQFRSRAGVITNLGACEPAPPKPMYKRFYFVDWVVLTQHKARLLPDVDIMVDGQRPDLPVLATGDDLRAGLEEMGRSPFRVRPWFEPGPWGGQWIKRKIPQLPQDVPNYAWSFELIVPENGLMFESGGLLLEVSFDCLMFHDPYAVLDQYANYFGFEFPVRFDFLDTVEGGNLSVQCHPRPAFIREHFGETYTQDETYYILDCVEGATVYLGFREDIDPDAFRAALERSHREGTELDVERYVNVEPANKHDLFLIPNGTIHCSGVGNLVLEISATTYIFTFKMYDWQRMGLDGKPRPINIERAFENLYFDRKGARIAEELLPEPVVVEEGDDYRLIHLPTHREHFYDIHRIEFTDGVEVATDGSPHVLSLVEGESVIVETENGRRERYNYAETFVIPAAAKSYRLINEGEGVAKVVKAFLKPEWFERPENGWLKPREDFIELFG